MTSSASDRELRLGSDEILVFRVKLVPGAWAPFLGAGQLDAILRRFSIDSTRRETISCEGALRLILGRLIGEEPRSVDIKRADKGKPYIEGGLGFSVTHAHDLGLVAVGRRERVGVDIEPVDHHVDCSAIADAFFPPKERGEILATPLERRLNVLLHAFTRFESAVKATGEGLTIPADDFTTLVDGMRWQHVDVGRRWIACVTADHPPWTVRVRDAADLL